MMKRATILLAASGLLAACSASGGEAPKARTSSGTSIPTMSEEEVRQELADRGYSEVYDLRPQADGGWMGSALLSGKQRQVKIGPDGSITTP